MAMNLFAFLSISHLLLQPVCFTTSDYILLLYLHAEAIEVELRTCSLAERSVCLVYLLPVCQSAFLLFKQMLIYWSLFPYTCSFPVLQCVGRQNKQVPHFERRWQKHEMKEMASLGSFSESCNSCRNWYPRLSRFFRKVIIAIHWLKEYCQCWGLNPWTPVLLVVWTSARLVISKLAFIAPTPQSAQSELVLFKSVLEGSVTPAPIGHIYRKPNFWGK